MVSIADDNEVPEKDNPQQHLKKLVQSYTLTIPGQPSAQPKLVEDSIFNWSNPLRTTDGGVIYLWTLDGRPTATLGVWKMSGGNAANAYEWQSLSTTPLSATPLADNDIFTTWSSEAAGIEFKPLVGEDKPKNNPNLRASQMRSIATKHFTATLNFDTPDAEKLRLLPTPLYKYADKPADVIDGAMFAFTQDTDPEVLLILEARKSINDEPSWFFAMAPSTSHSVQGMLDNDVAMSATRVFGSLTREAKRESGTYVLRFWNEE